MGIGVQLVFPLIHTLLLLLIFYLLNASMLYLLKSHFPSPSLFVAYKFEASDQTVVVTGDTMYSDGLIDFSKGADLVVMDGMLTELKEEDPFYDEFQRIKPQLASAHITLEEIGQILAKANVKKVVLTHLMNGEMDKQRTTQILRYEGYEGGVIIAETNGKYEVE
ncbi:MBL fold metallo-hydrolase [Aquibacillus sediminis]|uniref:MBL fold metallo-hydrolase n=1 Tax=Aquibacillus sediminis TaxID=2574734 RepID=UPI001486061F|nr:MBL fold metallo-hydrolase [Aquibacillus sediminis]